MSLAKLLSSVQIELRDYQLRLGEKALAMYRGPFQDRHGRQMQEVDSVLLESPTGSGKTVMGLSIAKFMEQEYGYRVGWVAMRRNLLAQAATENRHHQFNVDLRLISMFDRNPPEVDFLVVDEAQHDGARSMASLHAAVQPKKLLGLTATPFRSDRVKLCFEQVIADVGIEQLIQLGFLSRYHHFTIDDYTPVSVAAHLLGDRDRWGKSLLFFHRLEQCLECQRHLGESGVRAEVVTARSNREQQLEDFQTGRISVLISMAILAEGFDCPELKTVFCRPSGRGCTIQMCGRVFRKFENLPHKQIVQSRDTRYPITRSATPDAQYVWVDGSWRSLTANQHVAELSMNTLQVVAQCQPRLPELLMNRRPSRGQRRYWSR